MSLFKKIFKKNDSPQQGGIKNDIEGGLVGLEMLYNKHALLSFSKQQLLGDSITDKPWQFDMSEGLLTFQGGYSYPMQVIGSLSFLDNTWMWAWANEQSQIPEKLLEQSHALKVYGQKNGIEELITSKLSVKQGFEHKIGMIASGHFETEAFYCANYGKGTVVVTINKNKLFWPELKKIEFVVTSDPRIVTSLDVDHRSALFYFLEAFEFEVLSKGDKLVGTKKEAVVTAEFDRQGRLTRIKRETG